MGSIKAILARFFIVLWLLLFAGTGLTFLSFLFNGNSFNDLSFGFIVFIFFFVAILAMQFICMGEYDPRKLLDIKNDKK